jgi:hypothetical protein
MSDHKYGQQHGGGKAATDKQKNIATENSEERSAQYGKEYYQGLGGDENMQSREAQDSGQAEDRLK